MKQDIRNKVVLTLLAVFSVVPAFAAGTDTWLGNTDANWNTAANWTTSGGSTPPASGDSLVFGVAGTAGTSLNNDISGLSVGNWLISGPGSFAFGGNSVTLGGALTNSASAVETINLIIGGAGTVVNSGSGTLILNSANGYTGGTVITAGTLKLGAANVVGTGNITNNGAILDLNGQTLTNAITTLVVNSFLTNSSGTAATVSAAIGSSSASQLGNFTVGASGNITLSDVFASSALTVTKTGSGTLTLGGANVNNVSGGNPLGTLTVNSGTVVLSKTGTSTAASGITVNSGATLKMDPANTTSGWQSWAGQINGGVTLSGGTFDLNGTSGHNNYMQSATGTSGSILTNSSVTPALLTFQERGSGSFANAESIGGNLSLSFSLSTGSGATFNFTGNNSYNGTNTISTGLVAFSGNNTMSGYTIVNGGTLALNSATAIGSQTLNISSGAIDNTSGANITLANNNVQNWSGSFTFAGTTNLNLGNGAVSASVSPTITANTNTLAVGGVVSGGANTLTKAGSGTLLLTGNNTWGNATLNSGNLLFGETASTPTESLGKIVIGNNSGTIGSRMIFSNATVNITGANNTGIGGSSTSTNNTLWIQKSTWNGNAQRLETVAGVGNTCIIDGSIATNFTSLVGGNSGTAFGTTILVTNGGKLYVNATALNELGRNTGANTNTIIITGAGSAWYDNSGGTATTGFSIGGTVGTTSNNVVQVNNGALWDHGGGTMRLNMGNLGSGLVINGGIVTNVYSLIIGNGANYNYVNVTNGGKFYCIASSGDFREIGRGTASTNSILISDAGSLWNGGGATWTISGTAGGTPVGDSITVANSGIFTNGSITVGSSGSGHYLALNNGTVYANTLTISSGGTVLLNGGSGDSLYADVLSGSSSLVVTGAASSASSLIVGWNNSSSTVGPTLVGNLALIKSGSGTVTLANANTYSGGATIKSGTLSVSASSQLGTNALTLGDATAGANATLLVSANVTITNNIAVATGSGTRTLSGNSASSTTTFSGNVALNNNLIVNKTGGDLALTGTFTGSGNITNSGSSSVFLTGPNSANWTGGLIIVGGSVLPGSSSQLNTNTVLSIASGASFNNNNNNATIAGINDISGSGGSIAGGFGSPVLTLKGSGNYSYSGVYSGVGGLNVSLASGASQTLAGNNTYSGNTTITSGTLALSGSGLITNSATISIAGGAKLDVSTMTSTFSLLSGKTLVASSGTGTIAGSVNLNAGSLVLNYISGTPALSVSNGTFTFNGNSVTVTVSGPQLTAGSYKLISKGTGGSVSGTVPTSVTVNGSGATAAASLQIISGELYLVVPASTALALASSENSSGFNDSVTFTASVLTNGVAAGNATGSMTFFTNNVALITNSLAGGTTNVSLSVLPRGTNIITAIYSGDINYLPSTNTLNQIVTNHPPVAAAYNTSRNAGITTFKVALSTLATNWSDADGDTISFVSVGTSTNGIILSTNGGYILYNNTNNVNDQFTYMIVDSYGTTATGVVNITVNGDTPSTQNIALLTHNNDGSYTLNLAGIPGYSYRTQASTNLSDWVDISTNTAGTNGLWQINDSAATNYPSRYYRTVYP